MPLVAAAHTDEPGVDVAAGDLGQREVDVGPPVEVDLLDHHRQLVDPRPEVVVEHPEQRRPA